MRSLLLSFFSLSLLACGGSPDPDAQAPIVDDAPLPPPRTADNTPTIPAPPPASVPATSPPKDITGTVIDSAGGPVGDASITVVDANGTKTLAKTDATGSFDVPSVIAPYDLKVSKGYPLVFFGLTTAAPQIRHPGATKAAPATSRKGTLVTAIDYPTCPTTWCSAQISSGSATGGSGRVYTSFSGEAHRSALIEIEHEWTNNATSDTVDVDVLLSDSTYTSFWHQKLETNALVNENAWLVLLAAAPKPVPRIGPTLVIGVASTIPGDWENDAQIWLRLPGQPVSFAMQRSEATNFVTHLPGIPGATYSVSAQRIAPTVKDPVGGEHLHDERSGARTNDIPIAMTDSIVMGLVRGPSLVTPKLLTTMSRTNGKVEWAPAPGRLMQVRIYGKGLSFVGYTTAPSISVARLAELGITIDDGRNELDLITRPAAAVEAALGDPNGAWSSASWTSEFMAFDVVP